MQKISCVLIGLFFSLIVFAGKPAKPATVSKESYFSAEYYYAFIEATKQFMLGNLKGSVALYNECIKANPYSSASYYQLSVIFTRVGDYERARAFARKAVEIDRKNIWYNYQLANIYASSNNTDSTVAVFEAMRKEFPDKKDVAVGYVNVLVRTQNYLQAITEIEKVETRFGLDENLALVKYEAYTKSGRNAEAEKILLDLVATDPEEVRYLGMLGEHYMDQDSVELGKDVFKKVLTIDPSNVYAELSLGDYYLTGQKYDSMYQYYAGAFSSAELDINTKVSSLISVLNDSILLHNSNNYVKQLLTIVDSTHKGENVVYTLWADYYLRNDSDLIASVYLDSLLAKDSRSYFIWEQYLVTLSRLENYSAVADQASLAIELFPDKAFLYFVQGMAYFNLKDYTNAIATLSKGISLKVERQEMLINMYNFLAESYRNVGNVEMSDESFEKALEIDPDNNMILNNYSYYLALRNTNLSKAKKMSAKTIATEPNNPTYLDTYGWILFEMKKYDEAYKYVKLAIDRGSDDNEEVLDHFGDILFALRKYSQAIEYYEKAKELSDEKEKYIPKIDNARTKLKE